MTAVDYEDNESKFMRKAKENPFVPAGKPFKHYSLSCAGVTWLYIKVHKCKTLILTMSSDVNTLLYIYI